MTCHPTLRFIVHCIVTVDYDPPRLETRVTLIDAGVCRHMGMIRFTCAHILFNVICEHEVARPMSPVHGHIFLSPLYNWQDIHLGWCWLYPTKNMDRILSQIQGWYTSFASSTHLAQAATIHCRGSVHNVIMGLINCFGTIRSHIQRDLEYITWGNTATLTNRDALFSINKIMTTYM